MCIGRGGTGSGEQVVEYEGRERESTRASGNYGNTETRERKEAGNQGAAVMQYPNGVQRFDKDKKARNMD